MERTKQSKAEKLGNKPLKKEKRKKDKLIKEQEISGNLVVEMKRKRAEKQLQEQASGAIAGEKKKKKKDKEKDKERKRKGDDVDDSPNKRRKPSPSPEADNTRIDNDAEPPAKHASILRKFQSVLRAKSAAITEPDDRLEKSPSEDIAPQGLVPLPQPAPSKSSIKSHISLDASLPPWLSSPAIVSPNHKVPFSELPLSEKLKNRISSHLKFEDAFAVQAAVLPLLLDDRKKPRAYTHYDLLVSAPTGSGKTLSYVLPIVQDLSSRTVTRLRALIIVPTRELVTQVKETAESLASGLSIGIAWGARSIEAERGILIKDNWENDISRPDDFDDEQGPAGRYSSKVDILICTPGRLVEHITTTPGFNLRSLKWMVVDEADRLLAQSFQEWLGVVMKALESDTGNDNTKQFMGALGMREDHREHARKVILSATMTKDAGKLAGLRLRKPKLIVIEEAREAPAEDMDMADAPEAEAEEVERPDEIFTVPSTLTEHYISVAEIEDKPLYLIQLLKEQDIRSGALVFTKSNESAARLSRLLEILLDGTEPTTKVGLLSGELNKAGRKRTLAEFKRKEIDVLVCSDLMSRGMDLPTVDHVINYDIPATTRAYVHRVGRTARAGNSGDAWSLVAQNEARWFWRNVGKGVKRAGGKGIVREHMGLNLSDQRKEEYEKALGRLGGEVKSGGKRE